MRLKRLPKEATNEALPTADLQGVRVLLVDDSKVNRRRVHRSSFIWAGLSRGLNTPSARTPAYVLLRGDARIEN